MGGDSRDGDLFGPIAGGLLVDSLGWEWIFFVNVPVGIVVLYLAWRLVPVLPTHSHRFDLFGVALSAVGMFCLVFGIQEGQTYDWGTIAGPVTVWSTIGAGVAVLALFVFWQSRNTREPLVPLGLFRDRNFSLSNLAISTGAFAITATAFPLMFYAQAVRGLSPTRAALLLVPMAVVSVVLAPPVGRLIDRVHPRYVLGFGFACLAGALAWLGAVMSPGTAMWQLLLPISLLGVANGFTWAPLATTANRNLPLDQAGAGAGVYNTTRQVGAVLGSAGIAVLMESRLAAELPGAGSGFAFGEGGAAALPAALREGFSTAMAQSMLLPAAVSVVGLVAALFVELPHHLRESGAVPDAARQGGR